VDLGWPIVLHPDAMHRIDLWREFGDLLYVENMDKRKPIGRTVQELAGIFNALPDALFCFDIAHARQVDSSMTEAFVILKHFGSRLRQVHISEVNTSSKHDRISRGAFRAFREVAHLIPQTIPIILETPVVESEIGEELTRAEASLRVEQVAVAWSPGQFAIQH
jgi:endonuclease IV